MKCAQAIEAMLEAEAAALLPGDDTELARHIRRCADCAAAAHTIVTQQRELERSLRAERPTTTVDRALARAGARATGVRRRSRIWRAAIPIAAAAGVAGILVSNTDRRVTPGSIWRAPEQSATVGFEIEPPPGKNVAVFEVEDRPDIVVVWFYGQGD
jgi:hypothetical protein